MANVDPPTLVYANTIANSISFNFTLNYDSQMIREVHAYPDWQQAPVIAGTGAVINSGMPVQETFAQLEERVRRRDERRAQRAREQALLTAELEQRARREQRLVNWRAGRLLCRYLNEEQRKDYLNRRRFWVVGSLGGAYLVCYKREINVVEYTKREGKVVCCWCAAPVNRWGQVPIADMMLAQKVELERSETEFKEVARVWHRSYARGMGRISGL